MAIRYFFFGGKLTYFVCLQFLNTTVWFKDAACLHICSLTCFTFTHSWRWCRLFCCHACDNNRIAVMNICMSGITWRLYWPYDLVSSTASFHVQKEYTWLWQKWLPSFLRYENSLTSLSGSWVLYPRPGTVWGYRDGRIAFIFFATIICLIDWLSPTWTSEMLSLTGVWPSFLK